MYNIKIKTIHIYGKIGSYFVEYDDRSNWAYAFTECANLTRVYFSKNTIN